MTKIVFENSTARVAIEYSEWPHLWELQRRKAYAILSPVENRNLLVSEMNEPGFLADDELDMSIWVADFTVNFDMGDPMFTIDGKDIDSSELYLNTSLSTGDDSMKLASAICGNSEELGFIPGEHRAWVADIIAGDNAIFRKGKGWEAAVELLRSSSTEPVYISNEGGAVDSAFWSMYCKWLDAAVKDRNIERDYDSSIKDWDVENALMQEWEDLGDDARWDMLASWADKSKGTASEISPERFESGFTYGHGMDAEELIKVLRKRKG